MYVDSSEQCIPWPQCSINHHDYTQVVTHALTLGRKLGKPDYSYYAWVIPPQPLLCLQYSLFTIQSHIVHNTEIL